MAMTLQDIKELKKQLGLTNAQLAHLSGVPLSTVQKVLGNTTAAPRLTTLRRLEEALTGELGDTGSFPADFSSPSAIKASVFDRSYQDILLRDPPVRKSGVRS